MNKSTTAVMFSSNSDDWFTPHDFYKKLHKEFNFTLDPCASHINHKCEAYFTEEDGGLRKSWEGHTVFVNPPYSDIKNWVRKCYEESLKPNTIVVLLIPSRTDCRYFHDYIFGKAYNIRFVKGRLKFGGAKNGAPFPSAVVVFRGHPGYDGTYLSTIERT